MSSQGIDPNVPLPPVDEDSDLVGENNERGVSDDDPNADEAPLQGVTLPNQGGGSYPLPGIRLADELEGIGRKD